MHANEAHDTVQGSIQILLSPNFPMTLLRHLKTTSFSSVLSPSCYPSYLSFCVSQYVSASLQYSRSGRNASAVHLYIRAAPHSLRLRPPLAPSSYPCCNICHVRQSSAGKPHVASPCLSEQCSTKHPCRKWGSDTTCWQMRPSVCLHGLWLVYIACQIMVTGRHTFKTIITMEWNIIAVATSFLCSPRLKCWGWVRHHRLLLELCVM